MCGRDYRRTSETARAGAGGWRLAAGGGLRAAGGGLRLTLTRAEKFDRGDELPGVARAVFGAMKEQPKDG